MVRCVSMFGALALSSLSGSSAHFLWLQEATSEKSEEAVVTFGEQAGVPGSAGFLSMLTDKITLLSTINDTDSRNLTLVTRNTTDGNAELVAPLDVVPPFRLQLAATFGVFQEDPAKPPALLKYWSSADIATKPNDWWQLQSWGLQSGLEITIRDPYMPKPGSLGLTDAFKGRSDLPGDQCDPGTAFQDGAACVVAVVRFQGQLLQADMNVTTFATNGSKIATASLPANGSGVVILKVPFNSTASFSPVFASVNYREDVPGEDQGQKYDVVDHWATTYARIVRDTHDTLHAVV